MVEPDLRRGLNPHFFRISLKLYPNCQDNRCHFGVVRSLVDFLVIPSNFSHVIKDQIEQIAEKLLLSMIEVTLIAQKAVNSLQQHSVNGIILGCTEIPLLLGTQAAAEDLINPAELLAEAAIRHAIE
jgi:aspartate/glutamate racemase